MVSANSVGELRDNEVDATPTKSLVIDMLTRDVDLDKAIIDLIDNSVDAAKTMYGELGPFNSCKIEIEINDKRFTLFHTRYSLHPFAK
jgi:hypothetical protein